MLDWTYLDNWIIAAGVLSAVACALLGNYLLLRRMSMMGDAISHAVLPGLAMAFILTGSRGSLGMFIGAAVVGVLTALFTQSLHRYGRVDEGAAMGVVFTILFAIGLIMIVRAAHAVDLDPNCVLYGAIELTPLDTVMLWDWAVPRAVVMLAVMCLINGLFTIVFYKELLVTSFDPGLAHTLGFRPGLMHYLLMTLVAVTAVAAFESVGSILVIAMLIVPGATAYLLTKRLSIMIVLSVLIASASAVLGHVGAITIPSWWGYEDTSTAGMMAVMTGLFFVTALFLSPSEGILSRVVYRMRMAARIRAEDVLGLLYRVDEQAEGNTVAESDLIAAMQWSKARAQHVLTGLKHRGWAAKTPTGWVLTSAGRMKGSKLLRSHRLWETYLHQQTTLPVDHLHATAERLEHITDDALREQLAKGTGEPGVDPQGRAIPKE